MDAKFKKYLLFPLFLFLIAFAVDKVFWIGDFPAYFQRTAAFVNYHHKEKLLDQLENYYNKEDRKKILVMFGNSRTMSFDNKYIERTYPDWILFNFSVPGGTSDYFYYYMERFQRRGIKPDFIYFAITPQGFNTTPTIAMDEVMLNGLSPLFIFRHAYYYSWGEIKNYIGKSLFWSNQNRPIFHIIMKRLRNDSRQAKIFLKFIKDTEAKIDRERGSVPYGINQKPYHESEDFLKKSALSTWNTFIENYHFSKGQYYFTEGMLRIAKEMGVRSKLVWAKVGPNLRNLKDTRIILDENGQETTLRKLWAPRMQKLADKYDSELLDLNYGETIRCDMFHDSSHMAGVCFHEFTDYLMKHMD